MTATTDALRVVVADDDPDIRMLVAIAARKAGLELVAQLDDGEAAWRAIEHLRPDVVVLDVSMPGLTGLEVCRLIRADPLLRQVRIVVLSAGVGESSELAGLDAGADLYLHKPFSPRHLVDRLSSFAVSIGAT